MQEKKLSLNFINRYKYTQNDKLSPIMMINGVVTSEGSLYIYLMEGKYEKLTLWHENVDESWFSIGGWTCIVAGVCIVRIPNCESTLCSWSWNGFDSYSTPSCVIVDHVVIVIPEHVLRRGWALWNTTITLFSFAFGILQRLIYSHLEATYI